MTAEPIPPAALAVMDAAAEDYRMITPPDAATAAGLAEWIATYLVSCGYAIRPQGVRHTVATRPAERPGERGADPARAVACPWCKARPGAACTTPCHLRHNDEETR